MNFKFPTAPEGGTALSSLRSGLIQRDRVSRGGAALSTEALACFTLTRFKQDVATDTERGKRQKWVQLCDVTRQHRARNDRHSGGGEQDKRSL